MTPDERVARVALRQQERAELEDDFHRAMIRLADGLAENLQGIQDLLLEIHDQLADIRVVLSRYTKEYPD